MVYVCMFSFSFSINDMKDLHLYMLIWSFKCWWIIALLFHNYAGIIYDYLLKPLFLQHIKHTFSIECSRQGPLQVARNSCSLSTLRVQGFIMSIDFICFCCFMGYVDKQFRLPISSSFLFLSFPAIMLLSKTGSGSETPSSKSTRMRKPGDFSAPMAPSPPRASTFLATTVASTL